MANAAAAIFPLSHHMFPGVNLHPRLLQDRHSFVRNALFHWFSYGLFTEADSANYKIGTQ